MLKKLTEWLNRKINEAGTDKALHHAVGALITGIIIGMWAVACGSPGVLDVVWAVLAAFAAVVSVSVYKELKLDREPDWGDVRAAVYGWLYTSLLFIAAALIF